MKISRVSLRLVCCLLGALIVKSYAGVAPLITNFLAGDGPAQARVGESVLFAATGLASPVRVFFNGAVGPVEATDVAVDIQRGIVVTRVPAGATTGDMTVRANGIDSPGFYFRVEAGTFTQGSDVVSGQVTSAVCSGQAGITGCATQMSTGGIGLSGAIAILLGGGDCGSTVFQDFATTDITGNYTMHGVDGDYFVLVFAPIAAGVANAGDLTTLSSTPAVLDIDLQAGTLVEGQVVDSVTLAGIPNARLSADFNGSVLAHDEVLADASGNFSMMLLEGEWSIEIAPPPGDAHSPRDDTVNVAGASQDLGQVPLSGGVHISGTITSAVDGSPLAGARIRSQVSSPCCTQASETRAAGDGSYLLVVPENQTYELRAEMGDRSTLQDVQVSNVVVTTTNQTINFTAGGAAIITGTVTDMVTALPIACLRVNAQGQVPTQVLGNPQGNPTFSSSTTAQDGTYRLRVPPDPAGYVVGTRELDSDSGAPEYASQTWNNTPGGTYFQCEGVPVQAPTAGGTTSGINFSLPLGAAVQGLISNESGSCTNDLSPGDHVFIDDGTPHGCSLGSDDFNFSGPGYRVHLLPPSSVTPSLRACVFPSSANDDPQCYNLKTPPAYDPVVIAPGGQANAIDFCLESCQQLTWYQDLDSDGYGNPSVTLSSCTQPQGYVGQGTDCNDTSFAVHPGAPEICNGADDNCNGPSDEGGSLLCDDGNVCTADTCGGVTGCGHAPQNEGAPCSDGNACTQTDTCQSGTCTGSNPVVCTASDQCHDAGTCSPVTGQCSSSPAKPNGTACNDTDACTQTDTCQSGVCTGANPVVCTASDQCHDVGTCAPATGQCSNPVKANGTACNDADACTQTDTCQAGTCTGANPVVCTASDQCHDVGTCAPATGQCSNPAKANGTTCNDTNACTQTDTCQSGTCTGANPVVCTASDQCHDVGTCAPATGQCSSSPAKPNGTACNDTDACTQTDTCQDGTCTGANPVVCAASDQCHDVGTCASATGQCSDPAKANGTTCNDTNACTQTDTCQSGTCTGANPVVCTASDQCHDVGTCAPATGQCSNPAKLNGTACSDANACTQTDTCQTGTCTGANPVVCTASDQCHNVGTCAPATGQCSNPAKLNGTACSDANACTQSDTCQSGTCTGANPVVCTASDQCHDVGTCAPATGQCSNPAKLNGTACSDADACTQSDTCQSGTCTGANPVVCTAPDQCHDAGTCAPATGQCSSGTPKANGTACNDTNACTGGDSCQAGACVGTTLQTPRIVTFRLSNGAPTTYARLTSLDITLTGDALEYIASEDAAFTGAQWQPYNAASPFTLSSGPGRKTVYVKLRACASLESRTLTDRITLAAPRVLSFALDDRLPTTTSLDVTLSTTVAGNPTEYLASEDRFFTNATWQPLTGSPTFTLSAGPGRKTVYFKVRNAVGESLVRRDAIRVLSP